MSESHGSITLKHHIHEYQVIGTRPVRHDGADKVTGRAQYGSDVRLSGMLQGFILRSPIAHGKILSLDTTEAENFPGVHAVVTGADLPAASDRVAELGEGSVNLRHLSANVLAKDKVLYQGHAIAAVAADNIHIAEEAAKLIKIEFEKLPVELDVRHAMQTDAAVLNDDVRTVEFGETIFDSPTNVAAKYVYEQGDPEDAFSKADVVIEKEFRTATVHQGYIEPHTSTALWHGDGRCTVWTSTQGAFSVRHQLAELLEIPLTWIKVVPTEIGGGFGGKISVYEQPVALLLSKKSSRPVQVTMNRTDVFQATGPTPGSYIRVKLGADSNGKLIAADAYLAYEAGAYPGSPVNAGCMCILACYDIPNARVEGYDVCVNKPRTNAYRAPGSTNAAFAVEAVVDEIAEKLSVDPLQFRIDNAAKEGTRRPDGVVYPKIGLVECLEAIRDSDHYKSKLEGPNRGRGVGSGFWFNAGLKSSVTVNVNSDGRVSLIEGSTDIGGTRTSLSMQLAETLGIAAEDVQPIVADTDSVGYTDVTGGSRVTLATGMAVHEAGLKIRDQMCERAARIWECDVTDVRYEDDGTIAGPDGKQMSFVELANKIIATGESITASASISAPASSNAFGVHCADIEVDPDTGKVEILRYTAAQDAGTAIHPAYVEGQIQGGVAQGVGWGLNEEYVYNKDGLLMNANFLDYRMPTCFDLPNIDAIIVEVPNPDHPYGVRGVGEVPICPPPATLNAAIHNAVGVRMNELPMSPPRVLHELLKNS
ncbi:Xanthine dehydrogenase molybdenum-binding subunit [Thalassoglobus polymorphus]|uniref:Xanthine dehydrogenase molybdenum-binding subunit n=2 Tax=Thalassoglobus polymorphus TaxID=2527994 RepID=A0A517QTY6_9PLAN|nr:Xanthine dehydrogenase molybdenum-binding subunit [Thalassoglobus polymorphus]